MWSPILICEQTRSDSSQSTSVRLSYKLKVHQRLMTRAFLCLTMVRRTTLLFCFYFSLSISLLLVCVCVICPLLLLMTFLTWLHTLLTHITVVILALQYLSNYDILHRFARVSRHCYRLAHDNALWHARYDAHFREYVVYVSLSVSASLMTYVLLLRTSSTSGASTRGNLSVNWLQLYKVEAVRNSSYSLSLSLS